MSTSQTLSTVAAETSPLPPGACRACERKGLPILPLRQAVLPAHKGLAQHGTLTNPAVQSSLRTLREGYVYVLLDQKQWQAYQVTPEGYLRQFNPYEMPRAKPQPLSKACLTAGHDLRASFLNIDTRAHKQAWIAFAQDPWPASVLDAYKSGKTPRADYRQRFTVVDLAALKADPAKTQALALEHAHPLAGQVAEYTSGIDDFGSIHGWYPRQPHAQAMRDYLRILEKQYGLTNGVAGIILPDPVGVVRELNNLRLAQSTQLQRWAEGPKNRYQHLTSQCLLGIRTLLAKRADDAVPDSPTPLLDIMPSESGTPPVFGDPAKERADAVRYQTEQTIGRLEGRYSESARKSFQDAYDKAVANAQKIIDAHAKDWAAVIIASPDWRRIVELDYADATPRSLSCRLQMVSDCLAGGITDAPPPPAKPGEKTSGEVLGPSGKVWQQLLSDPKSPAYIALQGQHTDLITALTPLFGAGAMPNDAGKKYYDTLKGVVGSEGIANWREHVTVTAADHLMAAMHDAANRLDKQLSAGVKAALDALHQGSAWLYGGAQWTQVNVQLAIGECFDILSENLHGMVDSAKQGAGRRVRAMVFSGLLAIPNPVVRKTVIHVTLWVRGSAEEVHKQWQSLGQGAKAEANAVWREVSAGAKNLAPDVAQVMKGFKVSASAARSFASRSFASMKSLSVGGVDGGLSLISLYFLQDSLKSSLADLDTKVGARHPEAVAAFYGASVGMMGGAAEVAGQTIKVPAEAVKAFVLRAGAADAPALTKVVGLGMTLVKAGGVIAAVGGIADGAANISAVVRVAKVGDGWAAGAYAVAGFLSLGGVWFSSIGALEAGVLFGPLGIGIALGLAAFTLVQVAKSNESDALELWARHSCFGSDPKHRKWGLTDKDGKPVEVTDIAAIMDSAIAALNAAVLGMDVALGFDSAKRLMDSTALATADVEVLKNTGGIESGTALNYRIVLPGFDPNLSRYRFTLEVSRFGLRKDGRREPTIIKQTLASGQVNDEGSIAEPTAIPRPDYTLQEEKKPTGKVPVLSGSYWLDAHNGFKAATLIISYWPDKTDKNGVAIVELTELA
ncbi:T6SS effector BTH_I2691 family protein [Dyella japonica]|uniref:Toxin VasX N-terminal region domain-containing protein n=1 Tax=Dyella japonica TaxID=231455 RepID=A0ABV2K0Y8_9GAMM